VTTTCLAAGPAAPGELLRLVMDGLTGAGLDARPPDGGDGYRLDITWPGARCTLAVGDCGNAEWEYCPLSPQDADPGLTADLATALLTGRTGPQPRLGGGHQRKNITFKGIVGLELKARGLDVELAVYQDEDVFDTFAEIVATVPGSGDDGQVWVTDDGGLTSIRDYRAETAAIVSAPDLCGKVADPASVASSVVEAVTRAMSLLRPAEARRAGRGWRLLTAPRSRVPHHGPVTPDCPVECLLSVLSLKTFNPLTRAYDAPSDEPRTVGDVMELYTRRQLRKIRGIGSRRVSEIEAALVLAGLNLAGHQQRPAGTEGSAR
jgi:hypothetical protein